MDNDESLWGMKDILNLDTAHRTLYGVDYTEIGTGFGDRIYMDILIQKKLEGGDISQIVEFGTWTGITSLHLGMSAKVNGLEFHTYDISDMRSEQSLRGWLDNMFFHEDDILKFNKGVKKLISKPNTFIFIDNGDKELEFNQYVPYIGKGSIIIIHDWNTEVNPNHISDIINKYSLESYHWEYAEALGSHCRAWIKTQ